MEVHVYDTYVKAKDGRTMHFDVITSEKDHDKALGYAKEWLTSSHLFLSIIVVRFCATIETYS